MYNYIECPGVVYPVSASNRCIRHFIQDQVILQDSCRFYTAGYFLRLISDEHFGAHIEKLDDQFAMEIIKVACETSDLTI